MSNNADDNTDIIRPLPSTYRGVKFRSRLEARWAAYFDIIGLPWQYEPEGYALPSGNYCPDFLCNDFFVEIKPDKKGQESVRSKLSDLARLSKKMVFCCVGPPSLKAHDAWGDDGREICCAVFCHYAFTRKAWGLPYFGDTVDWEYEDYYTRAANMRFENGVATEDYSQK